MKRLHVHVAVDNLAASIAFYSKMFDAEPSVKKDDYAKWMLEDPRVNFAISQRGAVTGLNHLGIQVESDAELAQMHTRLQALQPALEMEAGVACCYAKSDKYWVNDPSGIAWETFHTLDSIPVFGEAPVNGEEKPACCVPPAQPAVTGSTGCCIPAAAPAATTTSCCK